jgi:hypothetical protein
MEVWTSHADFNLSAGSVKTSVNELDVELFLGEQKVALAGVKLNNHLRRLS